MVGINKKIKIIKCPALIRLNLTKNMIKVNLNYLIEPGLSLFKRPNP